MWRLFEHSAPAESIAPDMRELLVDEAPIGFFAAKPDGTLAYLNHALKDLLGPDAEAPLSAKDFLPRDYQRCLRRDKKEQGAVRVETLLKTAKGDMPVVVLTSWPAGDDHNEDGLSRSIIIAQSAIASLATPITTSVDARSGRVADPMFDNAPFGAAHLDGIDASVALVEDSNGAFME